MNIPRNAIAAGLGLIVMTAGAASAQQGRNCGPRDVVVQRLASGYSESRQSIGLGPNNQVVEVFASDETGPGPSRSLCPRA